MNHQEPQTPPGWYPAGDVQRYWDGEQWTEHTAPLDERSADWTIEEGARSRTPSAGGADWVTATDDGTRADIASAMSKMSYKLGSKREIKRLPDHLWNGEVVEQITGGRYGPGTGIVVLTNQRLFFLKDGIMSKTSEDFPIAKISSIQWSSGMLLGKMIVFASGNKAEITNVQKSDGKAITDSVRAKISGVVDDTTAAGSVPQAQEPPSIDVYEQLKKLGELRDAGILTEEEFTVKKQALLDQI